MSFSSRSDQLDVYWVLDNLYQLVKKYTNQANPEEYKAFCLIRDVCEKFEDNNDLIYRRGIPEIVRIKNESKIYARKRIINAIKEIPISPWCNNLAKVKLQEADEFNLKFLFRISAESIPNCQPIYWGYYLLQMKQLADMVENLLDDFYKLVRQLDGENKIYSRLLIADFHPDVISPISALLPKDLVELIFSYDVACDETIVGRLQTRSEFQVSSLRNKFIAD